MVKVVAMRESESYGEVVKDVHWRKAMEGDMETLVQNEIWNLVDALKGVMPIGCTWVYKVKYNVDGFVRVQGLIGGQWLCTTTRHRLQ